MKYCLDPAVCKKEGVPVDTALYLLSLYLGQEINTKTFNDVCSRGGIVYTGFTRTREPMNVRITQQGIDLVEKLVLDSEFRDPNTGEDFYEDLAEKKRWIGYSTNIIGRVIVNEGAKKAMLEKDSSLLPIGVVRIDNDFKKGEVVSICDEKDVEFARGIVNYHADDCKRLIGKHSKEISELLGFKNDPELITRDYITIL